MDPKILSIILGNPNSKPCILLYNPYIPFQGTPLKGNPNHLSENAEEVCRAWRWYAAAVAAAAIETWLPHGLNHSLIKGISTSPITFTYTYTDMYNYGIYKYTYVTRAHHHVGLSVCCIYVYTVYTYPIINGEPTGK